MTHLQTHSQQPETHRQQTKNLVEARQGETTGHMRWVLGISLSLAIVALGLLYLWFLHGQHA